MKKEDDGLDLVLAREMVSDASHAIDELTVRRYAMEPLPDGDSELFLLDENSDQDADIFIIAAKMEGKMQLDKIATTFTFERAIEIGQTLSEDFGFFFEHRSTEAGLEESKSDDEAGMRMS